MSGLPVLHREKELSKWKRGERLGSLTDNSVLRNAVSLVKSPIPAGVVNLSGHFTREHNLLGLPSGWLCARF